MLKLMEFIKSSPTRAAFVFEGETAELDELLRRAASMALGIGPVVAPAPTPPPPVTAAAVERAVAAVNKAVEKAVSTPAKGDWVSPPKAAAEPVKEPEPAGAKAPVPQPDPVATIVADAVAIPAVILAGDKLRPMLRVVADLIRTQGAVPTVQLIVDWCVRNQSSVPLLAQMADTLIERVTRTAGLVVEA